MVRNEEMLTIASDASGYFYKVLPYVELKAATSVQRRWLYRVEGTSWETDRL